MNKWTRQFKNAVCLLFTAAVLLSCAGPQKPYADAPIEFEYEMQGETYSLNVLRGKPLLLVLVRTSEVTNEMHLDQIQQLYDRTIRRMNILVLSIAPNEAPMLDMFVAFHDYPFHIGMAPWNVSSGQSGLGILPTIPSTYILDAEGRVIDLIPGATNGDQILETLRRHRFIP